MILGCSTGCLHKLTLEAIETVRATGCNAIELGAGKIERLKALQKIERKDLVGFEYISLHMPIVSYARSYETRDIMEILQKAHDRIHFQAMILHPWEIKDWSFFNDYDLPIVIENMDRRKPSCQGVKDLERIFQKTNFKMCLDVNHIFTNDKTMKLGQELWSAFGDRIAEIHVSGFSKLHDPLFKTKQDFILDAIENINVPMIIESSVESVEDLQKEYDYIKQNLENR